MNQTRENNVTHMRPKLPDLHETIRRIAIEDKNVYLSEHARERMDLRSITRIDVIRVLSKGHIDGDIVPGQNPGEWKCKVVANIRGSRDIGVITLVISNKRILVKTTEWEDL